MSVEKFEVCVCTVCKVRQAAKTVDGSPKINGWGNRTDTRDNSRSGLMCPACFKKAPAEPHHLDTVFENDGWVSYGKPQGASVRAALSSIPVLSETAFGPHETPAGVRPEIDVHEALRLLGGIESWILAQERSIEDLNAWVRLNTGSVLGSTSLVSKTPIDPPKGLTVAARIGDLSILLPTMLPSVDGDRVREVALWLAGVARGRLESRRYERGMPTSDALGAVVAEECWILAPQRSAQELAAWTRGALWPVLGMTSRWTPKGVNGVKEEEGAIDIPDELSPFVNDLDHLRNLALWISGTCRGFVESGVVMFEAQQPQAQPQQPQT